ncbi:hypothetical protein [Streptomyces sp. NPDC101150]|uniref:hypothetical protein n=1 Tax=Streptomyces sp. NPDC101150 TaxID=3366114 RepID=UPI0037F3A870
MLRSSWIPGSAPRPPGPVLVSVTDFRFPRHTGLPGIWRAASRLAAGWPELEGAVGMWLWAAPARRHCGAVAVWRDEAALRGFVGWPPHVAVMRAYRDRGRLTSATWTADRFEPSAVWARARTALRQPPP